jgi:KUP system potassium uptake protein
VWGRPKQLAVAGAVAFLIVDLTFFAANLPKVAHGGWFPLAIAAVVFIVLTTWQRGREIVTKKRTELEGPLRDFVEEIRDPDQPISRSPRTGIFLDANPETTPLALRANVEHNCVLHESVVIVTVVTLNVPHVDEDERVTVDDLGYRDDGITHVLARFGYMERPNVPAVLRQCEAAGLEGPLEVDSASYFLSTIELHPGDVPGLARWRKRLFVATSRIADDAAEYFGLPQDRTIIMGSRLEV